MKVKELIEALQGLDQDTELGATRLSYGSKFQINSSIILDALAWTDIKGIGEGYASTHWTVDDVHTHRDKNGLPKWTDEKAAEWLSNNQKYIISDMVERGWDSMSALMDD